MTPRESAKFADMEAELAQLRTENKQLLGELGTLAQQLQREGERLAKAREAFERIQIWHRNDIARDALAVIDAKEDAK